MIKQLHIFTLKSFIGPFILTFIISEFVLMMQFLWLYISDLVGKGLDLHIILEIILYFSANLVQMALPLSILLASIMVFGNMAEHFELTAIKSAGISLQRIMLPLMVLTFIISGAAFMFSNNVLPYTNLKGYSLLYDISLQRPELNIKAGIFNDDIEGYRIKISKRSEESSMMYDFMIYDHSENRGNTNVILADSGSMETTNNLEHMIITLYQGSTYEEMAESISDQKKYPQRNDDFDKEVLKLELPESEFKRTSPEVFKHDSKMKSMKELSISIDSLSLAYDLDLHRFVNDLKLHKYFTNSNKFSKLPRQNKTSNLPEINLNQLKVISDLDSLFTSLNGFQKRSASNSAFKNSRKIQDLISNANTKRQLAKKNIIKHKYAWHEKINLSLACFIFFFIGAPLGAIIRKGGFGLPILVSVFFFLIYYLVSITGKKLAVEGILEAWQAAWLSTTIMLPLGIFFTYKASTDSTLLDFEYGVSMVKKLLKLH